MTLLPEWSPVRAVLLAWPPAEGDWQDNYAQVTHCYWNILAAISAEVDVWLLLPQGQPLEDFRRKRGGQSVVWERVTLINSIPYDDTWVRDYGPLSLTTGYMSFTFNGWGGKYPSGLDNDVACALQEQLAAPVAKGQFVCEGGGLETNGETLLLNADCIVDDYRNPGMEKEEVAKALQEHLGVMEIEWLANINLTGDDTDGHIDTIARFASPNRLLYTGWSQNHPDAAALQRLKQQLTGLAQRRQWQLYELPTPLVHSALDGRVLPATYANFLIANGCVFAPIYGRGEDEEALSVLRVAFPRHRVIAVRCEALLEQHGSLHCATMQISKLPA